MLTQKQKDQYCRDGYLLVPNVLTGEQVRWLRAFFRPKFDSPRLAPDTDQWLLDIFGCYPEVRWLCFHEPTLGIIRSLFGDDIVLLPESTAQFNYSAVGTRIRAPLTVLGSRSSRAKNSCSGSSPIICKTTRSSTAADSTWSRDPTARRTIRSFGRRTGEAS